MSVVKKKMFKPFKRAGRRRNYPRKQKLTTTNLRGNTPIPSRYITKMKYCQNYKPVNSTGLNNWQVRLNSLFDPDLTSTGHQPYARDTLAALYARYRVISCSYALNAYSENGLPIQVSVLPANESHLYSTVSEARENPRAKYMLQSQNDSFRTLKGKVYIPSLMGRTKAQYMADDRFQSSQGSSPAENAILNIQSQLLDETLLINPGTVFVLTLTYTVEFFDQINQVQS